MRGSLMKRIDLHYGGQLYSVGNREIDEMRAEVESLRVDGGWIVVNDGEGAQRDAHLWVTAGVPLALIPIPDETGGSSAP